MSAGTRWFTTSTPSSPTAPIASSGRDGTPSLRTTITSNGAPKARATSAATGTPPRGNPSTTTSSPRRCRSRSASRRPASTRSTNRTTTPRPLDEDSVGPRPPPRQRRSGPRTGKIDRHRGGDRREVVTMTTAVYSCCAAIRTVHTATRDSSWAFFAGLPAWPRSGAGSRGWRARLRARRPIPLPHRSSACWSR